MQPGRHPGETTFGSLVRGYDLDRGYAGGVPLRETHTCPWCGTVALYTSLASTRVDPDGRASRIISCVACDHQVYEYGRFTPPPGYFEVEARWPTPEPKDPDSAIPEAVVGDWVEAYRCQSVKAHKAAAAMARRAVQGVCIDQGAKKGHAFDQINELIASGKLHKELGSWAHRIRLLGNSGAHPGDDGLETVTAAEADDVLEFLDRLLEWTYVMPARLEKSMQQAKPQGSQE